MPQPSATPLLQPENQTQAPAQDRVKTVSPHQHFHMLDTSFPESHMRTRLWALPFPHPKWGVETDTGRVYEDVGLMVEAGRGDDDEDDEGEGVVRASVEGRGEEAGIVSVEKKNKTKEKKRKRESGGEEERRNKRKQD